MNEHNDEPETPAMLDPEAALLCALLHARDAADTALVFTHLEADDFAHPRYGELFQIISQLAAKNEPHDPPHVLATMQESGLMADLGKARTTALTNIALLGTPTQAIAAHALDVLRASYRRAFTAAATRQMQAANESPTAALFDLMVTEGTRMRREYNRLTSLAKALGQHTDV